MDNFCKIETELIIFEKSSLFADYQKLLLWTLDSSRRLIILTTALQGYDELISRDNVTVIYKNAAQIQQIVAQIAHFCLGKKSEWIKDASSFKTVYQQEVAMLIFKWEQAAYDITHCRTQWFCFLKAHIQQSCEHFVIQGSSLKQACRLLPALIVGAGPSLENNLDLVVEFQKKGIVISCGSAYSFLQQHGIRPHIVCGIDPNLRSCTLAASHYHYEIPLFFTFRYHPYARYYHHSRHIYFPGISHHPFIKWFQEKQTDAFQLLSGFDTAYFAFQIACFLDCCAICFLGVDYTDKNGKKYFSFPLPSDYFSKETYLGDVGCYHALALNEAVKSKDHVYQLGSVTSPFLDLPFLDRISLQTQKWFMRTRPIEEWWHTLLSQGVTKKFDTFEQQSLFLEEELTKSLDAIYDRLSLSKNDQGNWYKRVEEVLNQHPLMKELLKEVMGIVKLGKHHPFKEKKDPNFFDTSCSDDYECAMYVVRYMQTWLEDFVKHED